MATFVKDGMATMLGRMVTLARNTLDRLESDLALSTLPEDAKLKLWRDLGYMRDMCHYAEYVARYGHRDVSDAVEKIWTFSINLDTTDPLLQTVDTLLWACVRDCTHKRD